MFAVLAYNSLSNSLGEEAAQAVANSTRNNHHTQRPYLHVLGSKAEAELLFIRMSQLSQGVGQWQNTR